jgi:hypothetical protein
MNDESLIEAGRATMGPMMRSFSPIYVHPMAARMYFGQEAGVPVGGEHTVGPFEQAALENYYAGDPNSPTIAAALLLDQQLSISGCAGCGDPSSELSRRTLAFKQAAAGDPFMTNRNNFNPNAMSAFGPGTLQALQYALGKRMVYGGGACTDSSGACAGAGPGPQPPGPGPGPAPQPPAQASSPWGLLALAAAGAIVLFMAARKKKKG